MALMVLLILEWTAGLLLAVVTLRDVFDTVVVPGPARGPLKVARRLVHACLPILKRVTHRGIGVGFAPAMLLGAFATWMLLLVVAFALMMHAHQDLFSPPLEGFGHALYVAGSAMGTINVGDVRPSGIARAEAVIASFCSLAVLTMAVTYLLEVQSNISSRDKGVLKMTASAGDPPSAVGVLERYAAPGLRERLPQLLAAMRDWCADVLQSHASHPTLIYFRSAGSVSGWPSILGALLDVALLLEFAIDEPATSGSALLLRDEASRLGDEIAALVQVAPVQVEIAGPEITEALQRLQHRGYALRPDFDQAAFAAARRDHGAAIAALSRHLGAEPAPLLPAGPHC